MCGNLKTMLLYLLRRASQLMLRDNVKAYDKSALKEKKAKIKAAKASLKINSVSINILTVQAMLN